MCLCPKCSFSINFWTVYGKYRNLLLENCAFCENMCYLSGYRILNEKNNWMKNKEKQIQLRDVSDVLDIIGGRWRAAILASLCDEKKRFNELKRDLGNITPRVLAKEMKYLEMNLLVKRGEHGSNAASFVYSLTEHGETLEPLIGHIVTWAQKHRKLVLEYLSESKDA